MHMHTGIHVHACILCAQLGQAHPVCTYVGGWIIVQQTELVVGGYNVCMLVHLLTINISSTVFSPLPVHTRPSYTYMYTGMCCAAGKL